VSVREDVAHGPQCCSKSDRRAQPASVDAVPRINKVNAVGCYGSVLLDEELRQSLAAMNGGRAAPWVYGCVLDHGHDGDHGAPACEVEPADPVDGQAQHWIRWPNAGPARLDRVEPSPPGRHSKPLTEPVDRPSPPSTVAPGTLAHPRAENRSPSTSSQTEELWAIAAAIDRLAEVVAAYLAGPPGDNKPD
jgi:hypothetical protein